MSLANLRIRSKLSWTIAITLFFLLLITAAYTVILHQSLAQNQRLQNREMPLQQLANDVTRQMLQARRAEKDFLLYKDPSAQQAGVSAAQMAVQQAQHLQRLSREAGAGHMEEKAAQIVQAMQTYQSILQTLAQGQERVGLAEDLGLQGAFRRASHALEAELQAADPDQLTERLSALLRQDLAYLLHGEASSAQELLVQAQALRVPIQKSSHLPPSLQEAFVEAVQGWEEGLKKPAGNPRLTDPLHRTLLALNQELARQQLPALFSDYLSMRRAEKDYLLRRTPAEAQKVQSLLHGLQERLAAAQWPGEEGQHAAALLAEYGVAFTAMLRQDEENDRLLVSLREAVRPVEPLSDDIRQLGLTLAQQQGAASQAFGERASVLLLLLSLLSVAICGVLCGAILRSIFRSLQALQSFSTAVSRGEWPVAIPPQGSDEMGQLATALAALVTQMHGLRLWSDRLLLVLHLVGRGIIPEPVCGDFSGRLQHACASLNQMLERLALLPRVSEAMARLSQGIPVEPLEEPAAEGAFKDLVTLLNQLIRQAPVAPPTPSESRN
ncbi:MAG: HAMP domain-containing protein [Magnetococcales bacterium]|nr:HAMP domain-containing protein [Magnetococcales bacterium]